MDRTRSVTIYIPNFSTASLLRNTFSYSAQQESSGRWAWTKLMGTLTPCLSAFDSVLNLVIDSANFAIDGTVKLIHPKSQAAKLKEQEPLSFLHFFQQHYAFTGRCLNATLNGLRFRGWWDSSGYVRLIPTHAEAAAFRAIQGMSARTRSFTENLNLYQDALDKYGASLPKDSDFYAEGLILLMESLEHAYNKEDAKKLLAELKKRSAAKYQASVVDSARLLRPFLRLMPTCKEIPAEELFKILHKGNPEHAGPYIWKWARASHLSETVTLKMLIDFWINCRNYLPEGQTNFFDNMMLREASSFGHLHSYPILAKGIQMIWGQLHCDLTGDFREILTQTDSVVAGKANHLTHDLNVTPQKGAIDFAYFTPDYHLPEGSAGIPSLCGMLALAVTEKQLFQVEQTLKKLTADVHPTAEQRREIWRAFAYATYRSTRAGEKLSAHMRPIVEMLKSKFGVPSPEDFKPVISELFRTHALPTAEEMLFESNFEAALDTVLALCRSLTAFEMTANLATAPFKELWATSLALFKHHERAPADPEELVKIIQAAFGLEKQAPAAKQALWKAVKECGQKQLKHRQKYAEALLLINPDAKDHADVKALSKRQTAKQ